MSKYSFRFFLIGLFFSSCITRAKMVQLVSDELKERNAKFAPSILNSRIESASWDSLNLVSNYCNCEVKERLFAPFFLFTIKRKKMDCKIDEHIYMTAFIEKLNHLVSKDPDFKKGENIKIALKFIHLPNLFKLDFRSVSVFLPLPSSSGLFLKFDDNTRMLSLEDKAIISYKIFNTNKNNEAIVVKEGVVSKTLEEFSAYKDEYEYRRCNKFIRNYLKLLDEKKLELINSAAVEIHNLILESISKDK